MTCRLHFVYHHATMCGIFGIINHKDAANLVYLGLYALQHRGQESAGIATVSHDGTVSDTNLGEPIGSSGAGEQIIAPGAPQMHVEKEMGHVADIFTHERLARLPGDTALGHVRYSTAGGSMLCNAQPIVASTSKGLIALAHNGNLINGAELRRELEEEGAIFNTMSDTEVMVHLIARSRERDLERALIDALSRVKGAYSIAMLTPGKIIASRENLSRRQHGDRVRTFDARKGIDERALEIALARPRNQMHHDLGVAHGVENCALFFELAPQLGAVDQISVVRQSDQTFAGRGHDRLRVAQHRAAGRGVAHVPEGRVAGQSRQTLVRENVGDVTHLLLDVHLRCAGGDDLLAGARRTDRLAEIGVRNRAVMRDGRDSRALLSAMLQGIEAEVDEIRRVFMIDDAEDSAHRGVV